MQETMTVGQIFEAAEAEAIENLARSEDLGAILAGYQRFVDLLSAALGVPAEASPCDEILHRIETLKAWADPAAHRPRRERLPATRMSLTHKFAVAGHEGYLTVGLYPDGRPGELFVVIAKEGSTVAGLLDAWATAVSLALQNGVSLSDLCVKFMGQSFEPSGWSGNDKIPRATSLIDYVARWLELTFLLEGRPSAGDLMRGLEAEAADLKVEVEDGPRGVLRMDGPPCPFCGTITIPAGRCHRCPTCGESLGCS